MTYESDPAPNPTAPRGVRFRFGLKALFVLMTLLCVSLGWKMARQRKAAEIIARSSAVLNLIEENISAAPQRTSFTMPLHLRQRTTNFLKRTRPNAAEGTARLGALSGNGKFNSTATRTVSLDATELLSTKTIADASIQLRSHYERGLAKIGLRRTVDVHGNEKASTIWQKPGHGLHVVIDVDVDSLQNQADVRVIYLHSESLSLW